MNGIAIFAADPGGKTGVAWGWFNSEADTVGSAVTRARARGSLHAAELRGDEAAQGRLLRSLVDKFLFRCNVELSMDMRDVHIVFEDFHLRQLAVDLAPVQVTYAFAGVGVFETKISKKTDEILEIFDVWSSGANSTDSALGAGASGVVFQQPSEVMGYATNTRLREWGAWVVGSEHARDAMRHLCKKLSNELE